MPVPDLIHVKCVKKERMLIAKDREEGVTNDWKWPGVFWRAIKVV
jgi:hypothetical protein